MRKGILAAFLLIVCLLLPDALARISDVCLKNARWDLKAAESYRQPGALVNRVAALESWKNASQTLFLASEEEAESVGMWEALSGAGLIPAWEGERTESARVIALSPRAFAAEYRYVEQVCRTEQGTLTVWSDEVSGQVLRVELTGAAELLTGWEKRTYELLHAFAEILGYSRLSEDDGSYSDFLRSTSAYLEGTPYRVSVRIAPEAGVLLYKLSAASG